MVPSSFVPQEDEGYFMCIVQAPAGASLEYTTEIAKKAEQIIYADKDVAAAFSVMGFSFSGAAPNNGMIFIRLKDYEERQQRRSVAAGGAAAPERAAVHDSRRDRRGVPAAVDPGPVARSAASSSKCSIRPASTDINALAGATFGMMGAANQSGQVQGAFSSFRADDPQLIVDIDRDKARSLGLPLREVTDALQVFLGSQYVNDFDFNNRAYRVYVQADQRFRASPANLKQLYARAANGDMIPLDTRGAPARDDRAAGDQPLQPVPLGRDHRQPGAGAELGPDAARRWRSWRARTCRPASTSRGRGSRSRSGGRAARPA